jgi:hypothetical protein
MHDSLMNDIDDGQDGPNRFEALNRLLASLNNLNALLQPEGSRKFHRYTIKPSSWA